MDYIGLIKISVQFIIGKFESNKCIGINVL